MFGWSDIGEFAFAELDAPVLAAITVTLHPVTAPDTATLYRVTPE
jgi:hypothetical protein